MNGAAIHHDSIGSMKDTQETIRTVADVSADFALVQDSQDVAAVLQHIGRRLMQSEVGCLFVQQSDGDYSAVYMCRRFIPYLSAPVWRLA